MDYEIGQTITTGPIEGELPAVGDIRPIKTYYGFEVAAYRVETVDAERRMITGVIVSAAMGMGAAVASIQRIARDR